MQKRTFNRCPEHQISVLLLPCSRFRSLRGTMSALKALSGLFAHVLFSILLSLPPSAYFFSETCPCPCPVNISKTHMKVRTHNRNTSSIGIGYMYVTALKMQHAWTGWMFRGFQGANGFRHVTFQDIITTREQEVFLPTKKTWILNKHSTNIYTTFY